MPSDTCQSRLDRQLSRLRGEPITNNPHDLGTAHSRAWAMGYREIEEKNNDH